MKELADKIAIITGAGSGIGKAIALKLAGEGAIIYLLEVDQEKGAMVAEQILNNSGKAEFLQCSVTEQSQVKKQVEKIYQKEKKLDILINNAGVSHIGTAENTSEADFDRIFAVNVKGVYNCLHVCLPIMKNSGGGVIINMSSVAAELGLPDRFAYSMSKGAVSTMTYSVARDFIDSNIRCNAIAPGRVHTPFVDDFLEKNYPGQEQEMFEKLSKTQPIGRMGKPEEIAELVAYLCSDRASFITGTTYPIDGGFVKLNT